MKKVMVFGTFDILHEGHKNFFKQARKYGDYLIVVIARDKTVKKIKGKLPHNNEKTRKINIIKAELVDKVVLGDLKDKHKKIKELKPDVICLGYDQKKFVEGLSNFNIKIVKLKPFKPEIYKSSILMIKRRSNGKVGRS
jgi:FAD synthetase